MKARLAASPMTASATTAGCAARSPSACAGRSDCGIDIVADGEQSKPGFFTYVKQRLAASSRGRGRRCRSLDAERQAFPEYYQEVLRSRHDRRLHCARSYPWSAPDR